MPELLIGCGNHRQKILKGPSGSSEWTDLTTLDFDPNCGADVEHDLERLPLPLPEGTFDEIHAYHVLEHVGRQGDFRFFFAQWSDFWRVLRPGGMFCGIVPAPGSVWEWGDPGHTRLVRPEMLTYLNQTEYDKQVGKTALADYRHWYRADFEPLFCDKLPGDADQLAFVLQAVKPSRVST